MVAGRPDSSLDLVRWLASEHPEIGLLSLRPDFELAVESGLDLGDLTPILERRLGAYR